MHTILAILLPFVAAASCPNELKIDSRYYCMDMQWETSEIKVRGQFQPSTSMSPQMVVRGTVPQRWQYSRAYFQLWRKGDTSQTPVQVSGFRVFPYMFMLNGHHHGTSYRFEWQASEQAYLLSQVAFQQMPGCWSLRMTTSTSDRMASSESLLSIVDFENLNDRETETVMNQCEQVN